MKAGDLINLLMSYDESDEVEIEIYETASGQYIDTMSEMSYNSFLTQCQIQ